MGTARFNIVDVFTDRPFAGNQLGVFADARALSSEQMQVLARELNFSECTFVLPPEQGGDARIRIFTPEQELPFAGHPTLGTAFVLAAPMQRTLLRLETGSGIVPVLLEREGARIVFGRMEQPLPTIEAYPHAEDLVTALGVAHIRGPLPVELYDNGVRHVYVEVTSADQVAWLEPDFNRLARFGEIGINVLRRRGRTRPRPAASYPPWAFPRTPRPAPLPARSRCISRATVGSSGASNSASPKALRSGGPRPCSLGWTGRRKRSSASR